MLPNKRMVVQGMFFRSFPVGSTVRLMVNIEFIFEKVKKIRMTPVFKSAKI